MARYFLELAYKGTNYAGFQVQQNAVTIQSEVEKAMHIYFRQAIELTGSSRTDKGVHARQNFFHFDFDVHTPEAWAHSMYHLNAILPPDIVIVSIRRVADGAHCRFDALSREYEYHIYSKKDPFLQDRAFFFPYRLQREDLQTAASVLSSYSDFTSFSKRNTQVKTFQCKIMISEWIQKNDTLIYRVRADRFLRGMVRGLTGTMLRVGTGKLSIQAFTSIIESRDCTLADFSVPPHGLFLLRVEYPDTIFI